MQKENRIMKRPNRMKDKIFIAILIIGFLVKLGYALIYHDPVTSDSSQYDAYAINLMNGHGYVLNNSMSTSNVSAYMDGAVPSAWRPPGYPFFLVGIYSVFGHSYVAVHIIQVLLSVLTGFIIYMIGKKLWSREAGLFGMFFFSFWPPFVVLPAQLLSETLSMLLVISSLYLTLLVLEKSNIKNYWLWLLLGFVLAYSSLVRPTYLYYPLFAIAILYMLGWKKKWSWRVNKDYSIGIAIILLIFILLVGGWALRNSFVFKGFIPGSTQQGLGIYFGTVPFNQTINGNPNMNDQFYNSVFYGPGNEYQKSNNVTAKGISRIMQNPFGTIWIKIDSLYNIWKSPYIANTINHPSWDEYAKNNVIIRNYMSRGSVAFFAFLYGYIAFHLIVILLFVLSLFFTKWWENKGILLIYSSILYLNIISFLTIGIDRYVLVAIPFMAMAAYAFISGKLFKKFNSPSRSSKSSRRLGRG